MRLLVDELYDSLYQQVTATKNFDLTAIRPHIYKHNSPSGNLKILLQDENGKLVASSNAVPIASIATLAFAHKYIRFDISHPIKGGLIYRIALEHLGGYAFSESAYIGWCRDFDLRKYEATYTPNTGYSSALDFEAWERREL